MGEMDNPLEGAMWVFGEHAAHLAHITYLLGANQLPETLKSLDELITGLKPSHLVIAGELGKSI